jgi:hypothetical protein
MRSATFDTVRWRPYAMSGRRVPPSEFIGNQAVGRCPLAAERGLTQCSTVDTFILTTKFGLVPSLEC